MKLLLMILIAIAIIDPGLYQSGWFWRLIGIFGIFIAIGVVAAVVESDK